MTEPDDDRLLTRLRAADPAAGLPPADPARVAHVLEAAMSDTNTRRAEARRTGTHDRSPLTWLVAAAAVMLIAAGAVLGLSSHGRQHPTAHPSVTALGVAAPTGRCLVPNVGVLREQTVAFRGTLTGLTGRTATFRVDHWYRGGPTRLATVTATPARLDPLVGSAGLRVGGDYLVAARGGLVTACGFSGAATPQRLSLYQRAYGG